jgi:hypothetical protein
MSMAHEGGCLCGDIRYKTLADPLRVTICHCRFCQRFTGSSYLVEPIFRKQDVVFATSIVPTPVASASRSTSAAGAGPRFAWTSNGFRTSWDYAVARSMTPIGSILPRTHIATFSSARLRGVSSFLQASISTRGMRSSSTDLKTNPWCSLTRWRFERVDTMHGRIGACHASGFWRSTVSAQAAHLHDGNSGRGLHAEGSGYEAPTPSQTAARS